MLHPMPTKTFSRLFFISVALALALLSGPAVAPDALHAAPDALLTVDREDDVSGLPCTSADDDCTLRSAIEQANGAGIDTITFDTAAGDMHIDLSSPLPALSDDDTSIYPLDDEQIIEIDANSVSGNVFEITGSDIWLNNLRLYGSGEGWANIWIHLGAQGVRISNNLIGDDDPAAGGCGQSSDSHSGIFISSSGSTPSGARAWISGNTIECHQGDVGMGIVITGSGADNVYIGENQAGEAGNEQQNVIRDNAGDGILIASSAHNNLILNSHLVNNAGHGIRLSNGNLNQIFGNTIAGNGSGGVLVEDGSSSNRFGCPLVDPVPDTERNVIRDNDGPGVHLTGADTETNFLFCNWIGVSDDGASAAPNDSHGVLIDDGAHHNNVGATFDTGNTISGNGGDGVRISAGDNNLVLGNYIGVNDGGGAAIPNSISGVAIVSGASDNTLGSATSDNAGNVISGNAQTGILVASPGATGNSIDGNHIGVGSDGVTALPNGTDGVAVYGATDTAIGPSGSDTDQLIHHNEGVGVRLHDADGALVGERNTVKYNQSTGVAVTGSSSGANVKVREVYSNGGLPIDLGNDGHTPNDPDDSDSGPNTLLNYPVITGGSGGTIEGTACLCTIYIYEAVGAPSRPSGGGILLDTVATDGDGNWSYTLPGDLTRFDVTMMALDTALNTSEMAPTPRILLPLLVAP
ncbi:MAG: right-handed parallel beta-helix repeat-containing protein [Chloroflexota bacterium]